VFSKCGNLPIKFFELVLWSLEFWCASIWNEFFELVLWSLEFWCASVWNESGICYE
jgi:hypothetical protein